MTTKLLNERSAEGKQSLRLPICDVTHKNIKDLIPEKFLRQTAPDLPEVSEAEVTRHYVNLSTLNHHVDKGFYPLGSCTMKYNPKINEECAADPRLTEAHPLQDGSTVQGALRIYYELESYLREMTGMARFTLQPAAGSHGELTGVMIMNAYHRKKGNEKKTILIPDSAHGTNPASVILGGFKVVSVKSTEEGLVDLSDLRAKTDE